LLAAIGRSLKALQGAILTIGNEAEIVDERREQPSERLQAMRSIPSNADRLGRMAEKRIGERIR